MPARVDELARKLIGQDGTRAAYIVVERLNQSATTLLGISGPRGFMPSTSTSGRYMGQKRGLLGSRARCGEEKALTGLADLDTAVLPIPVLCS